MKITIEAETDEEREHYPEPLPITDVHLFAMSLHKIGGTPIVKVHGPLLDVKTEAQRIINYVEYWMKADGRANNKS